MSDERDDPRSPAPEPGFAARRFRIARLLLAHPLHDRILPGERLLVASVGTRSVSQLVGPS